MSVNINSGADNEEGCIVSGLALRGMRLAMENKALLEQAGSMYVGTGKKNKIEITMDNGSKAQFEVPRTIAVTPPDKLDTDATYGIKFKVDDDGNVTSATLVQISTGSASK